MEDFGKKWWENKSDKKRSDANPSAEKPMVLKLQENDETEAKNDYNPNYESKIQNQELDLINYEQMFRPLSDCDTVQKSACQENPQDQDPLLIGDFQTRLRKFYNEVTNSMGRVKILNHQNINETVARLNLERRYSEYEVKYIEVYVDIPKGRLFVNKMEHQHAGFDNNRSYHWKNNQIRLAVQGNIAEERNLHNK